MSQVTPARRSPVDPAELRARRLVDLQRNLACIWDLDDVLSVLAGSLPGLLPVSDRVSVAFVEEGSPSMRVYTLLPASAARPQDLPRVRLAGTVVGEVARDGRPRLVADVRADRQIAFGHAAHERIRSTASVPILLGGRIAGVFNTGSRSVGRCDASLLEPLADVAAIVGPALLAAEGLSGAATVLIRSPSIAEDWPTRDENERRYLRRVLEKTSGVIEGAKGAARLLGLRPSTLRSRLKRLGVGSRLIHRKEGE